MKDAGGDPVFWKPGALRCGDCDGAGTVRAVAHSKHSGASWELTVPCRCQRSRVQSSQVLQEHLPKVRWHPPVGSTFEGMARRYVPQAIDLPGGQRVQHVWEPETWTLWVFTSAPQLAASYAAFLLFYAVSQALGRAYSVLGVTTDQTRGSWAAVELEEAVRDALRNGVAHDTVRDVVWEALTGG